ncbi:MAG: carbamoyltransferase C-terminal domain-containing protein [Thermoguttaceae bacterium]
MNAAYHESAAAITRGFEVVFAAEEERYTREKHAKVARVTNPNQLPWFAIRDCLRAANCTKLSDVDAVAYSLMPGKRLAMIGSDPYPISDAVGFGTQWGEQTFDHRVRSVPQIISTAAEVPSLAAGFHFIPHHLAHAACAYYASGLESAAVLVVDGIGESATTWLGRGSEAGLEMIEEIPYPHSIGMLWERIAAYLGFGEYDAAKVMGLAAFGDPQRFAAAMDRLFYVHDHGEPTLASGEPPFVVNLDLARFRAGDVAGLESLFGRRRQPDESPTDARFADIAAALQRRTEDALLALAWRLNRATGESKLAYGGGVALNCVANGRLERDGPFETVHVYAAPHDAGTAIGAALATARRIAKSGSLAVGMVGASLTPFLGGEFDDDAIDAALVRWGLAWERAPDPELRAASFLADGRIVAWFQGRMEFGPRALGNRSLLADPRHPGMRERLNSRIKHRESFRPFAASVLEEEAAHWFEFPTDRAGAGASRDLMLLAYSVRPDVRSRVPAVVHADGTCRIQTVSQQRQPRFHRLISAFSQMTGLPLILNTSYNEQEPLVLTPDDALATFRKTPIDALFLNDRLVLRQE